MAVVVYGKDRPAGGYACIFNNYAEACYHSKYCGTDLCPIHQFPEHHGKIVDADAIIETLEKTSKEMNVTPDSMSYMVIAFMKKMLLDAPELLPGTER